MVPSPEQEVPSSTPPTYIQVRWTTLKKEWQHRVEDWCKGLEIPVAKGPSADTVVAVLPTDRDSRDSRIAILVIRDDETEKEQ